MLAGHKFTWSFLRAAVSFPIIGIDFLIHHSLLLDVAHGRLSAPSSGICISLSRQSSGPTTAILLPELLAASVPATVPTAATAATPSAPSAAPTAAILLPEPSAATAPCAGGGADAGAGAGASSGAGPGAGAASARMISAPPPPPVPSSFQAHLAQFPAVLNPSKRLPPTSHGVQHHLQTQGPPVASPFRQLNPKKLADAKAEFAALEQDGVLRRSNSLWASPLHMVHKADGSWRPCSNYRRLNGVTVPDTYPLPNMMDFTTRMSGCKFFSKVDLRKGYNQIPMHEPDIPKTAIITPFGLFEYTRMTFGMRNAGNTFQWLMDRVMAGADAAFAYLDDVLIGSATLEQHLLVVADVFHRLAAAGLVVNAKKCLFKVPSIKFLGHRVTAGGIAPLPHRIATLQQHPRPGTVKELQGFLGTVNFYRRFVAGAARILKPLTDALRGGPPPSSSVSWDDAME